MAEYISREALRKHLFECYTDEFFDADMKKALVGIDVYVENMPAADVQPVKYGRWSECYTDSRLYSGICSVCGGAAIRSVKGKPLDYCPNCGARMDGDTECQ